MRIPEAKYVMMHYGDLQCMGEAFYLREMPAEGALITRADIVKTDGTAPDPREPVTCGFCRKPLKAAELPRADILRRAE